METTAHRLSADEKRERFGEGPWMEEPDRLLWRHKGYPCLINRVMSAGHLCGYVAVPPGHPWHGNHTAYAAVHGGLNYFKACDGEICHVPAPGDPEHVWWVGFDCGHIGCSDLSPGLVQDLKAAGLSLSRCLFEGRYRPIPYVRANVEILAVAALEVALKCLREGR